MKKTLFILLISFVLTGTASASHNNEGDWRQKIMSEKIAFLTMETGITPEEAQVFWPVYNEVSKMKDEAMHEVFKTYMELEKGIAEKKAEKEISKLLKSYIDALENQKEVDSDAYEKYIKALPMEKVAKLYVGEEKFRRQHIRKLHAGEKPGPKDNQAKR